MHRIAVRSFPAILAMKEQMSKGASYRTMVKQQVMLQHGRLQHGRRQQH